MKTKIFLVALALFASTGFMAAQNGNGKGKQSAKTNQGTPINPLRPGVPGSGLCGCTDFVDLNKNGICDNYENGTCTNCTNNGTRPQDGTGQKKGRK